MVVTATVPSARRGRQPRRGPCAMVPPLPVLGLCPRRTGRLTRHGGAAHGTPAPSRIIEDMPCLELDHACCTYPGAARPVLQDVSLAVPHGAFLTLLGPANAGKSTLLRMIAGLEETQSGVVRIDGRDVTRLPPKHRNVAMIFQNYALYPQMTVGENITFALRVAGVPAAERRRRIAPITRALHLDALVDRQPGALTGHERQRVAVARALARIPDLLLMDEPFTGLAPEERLDLLARIHDIAAGLGITVVSATSRLAETEGIDAPVAVLAGGRLRQSAPLAELRRAPADLAVARAVSPRPLVVWSATVEDGAITLGARRRPVPGVAHADVLLAVADTRARVRPEGALPATIEHTRTVSTEGPGAQELVLRLADRDRTECRQTVPGVRYQPGDRTGVDVDPAEAWVFAAADGALLDAPRA